MRPLPDAFTTVPWRVRFLDAVLDNLMAQTCADFDVHLYIPHVSRRTDEAYVLPPPLLSTVVASSSGTPLPASRLPTRVA